VARAHIGVPPVGAGLAVAGGTATAEATFVPLRSVVNHPFADICDQPLG